jgi:hypothetical protein
MEAMRAPWPKLDDFCKNYPDFREHMIVYINNCWDGQ